MCAARAQSENTHHSPRARSRRSASTGCTGRPVDRDPAAGRKKTLKTRRKSVSEFPAITPHFFHASNTIHC